MKPSVTFEGVRGYHGTLLKMRALIRKQSLDRLREIVGDPPCVERQRAIDVVLERNRDLRLMFPELAPVFSALPLTRSGLYAWLKRYERWGIDGLFDQKLGRSGKRRGVPADFTHYVARN